jgi:hypothetical protein
MKQQAFQSLQIFQFDYSQYIQFVVHFIKFNVTILLTTYKERARNIFAISSQTFVTSNKHVVHCTLKFYKLGELKGSDLRETK